MQISGYTTIMNIDDFSNIIGLLGPEIAQLPYRISLLDDADKNPFPEPAICVREPNKEIRLYTYHMKHDKNFISQYFLILFAFHELRHAWQFENETYKEEAQVVPSEDPKAYSESLAERDANIFAYGQIKKNQEAISRIFGFHLHSIIDLSLTPENFADMIANSILNSRKNDEI